MKILKNEECLLKSTINIQLKQLQYYRNRTQTPSEYVIKTKQNLHDNHITNTSYKKPKKQIEIKD